MATFQYTALDARGQQTNGTIEAASDAEAVNLLKQNGLYPTSVAEADPSQIEAAAAEQKKAKGKGKSKSKSSGGAGKKIPAKNLMVHTRQLATLIGSGLPLLRSLDVLGKQEPKVYGEGR